MGNHALCQKVFHSRKNGASEVRLSEIHISEACRVEVGTAEVATTEIGSTQVGTAEVCIAEIGKAEVGTAKIRSHFRMLSSPLVPVDNVSFKPLNMFWIGHSLMLLVVVAVVAIVRFSSRLSKQRLTMAPNLAFWADRYQSLLFPLEFGCLVAIVGILAVGTPVRHVTILSLSTTSQSKLGPFPCRDSGVFPSQAMSAFHSSMQVKLNACNDQSVLEVAAVTSLATKNRTSPVYDQGQRWAFQSQASFLRHLDAHNLLIWSRRWRSRSSPQQASRLHKSGIKRMVRDIYQISGTLSFDRRGRLHVIALQSTSSLAKLMLVPLQKLLALSHIAVILGQT